MLIDLRELLSGSQDEKTFSVSVDFDKFDDGVTAYNISDKLNFLYLRIHY